MESFLSATLPATTRAPSGEGPREKALPSLNACEQSPPRTVKRATWRSFVCRVDVLWTVLFFTLLASVGVGIAVITKTLVSNAVLESWHTLHDLHAHVIGKWLNQRISVAYYMGANLASLSARSSLPMQSESTLATICSILTAYDKQMLISTLSIASLKHREVINCMHGFTDNASTDRFAGYVSYNHSVNATYFVDKDTFRFHRPLRVAKKWPDSVQNISHYIEENTKAVPILRIARKCDTGHISDIGRRHIWRVGTYLPHLLALNTPACIVDRSLPDRNHGIITDYVHLHINGSRLLQEMDGARLTGARIALFINHTLVHADPLIMSNNWGQPTTHNTVIYTPLLQSNTTYLKSSDIHDPLMRAALKRVNLAALQVEGYRYTVDFQYECAPATVTAWSYMTSKGLVLPLIYVSGQADITPPHTCIDIVSNCTVAAAVLVLTAVFWCLIHRTFSKPLSGLQASLLASVEHGERQLYRPGRGTRLVRFAEVEALIKAHNKTMQQLRDVDAFVPEGLRQRIMDGTTSHSEDAAKQGTSTRLPRRRRRKPKATPLSLHLSTVVYVSIRANASITTALAPSPPPPPPPRLDEEQDPHWLRGQQRLIAAAERTAQAANTANSGPFPTPAALTAFITAVQELCHTHHGTLHRLCPDSCVLHFNSAVRAHIRRGDKAPPTVGPSAEATSQQDEVRRYAAQDARNAAAFALDLVSWVDVQGSSGGSAQQHGIPSMPDVRVLLDTSMFTCGQYCPAGSEQTLQVALGRDVQRELGGVPQRIGARLATTEETATLLRAELRHAGSRSGKVDHGVRQIPVDVLRTGRAGLDSAVVVLYEVLPGRAADDAAWQLYAHCCCDGFAHMLRGDYTGALAAYRAVAEIPDLEPGLLPPSMRRESVASTATGGAVSVQVARLMRECERCVRLGFTEPLCRVRLCPLGVDRILCDTKLVSNETGLPNLRMRFSCTNDTGMPENMQMGDGMCSNSSVLARRQFPGARERHVLEAKDGTKISRFVVPSLPAWMRDEQGLYWHLARSRRASELTVELVCQRKLLAMGSTGVLSSTSFFLYRDLHPVVAEAIKDAPTGPMSDELRSATPVCGPTSHQSTSMRCLFETHQKLKHPNLLSALGFSESIEGGVMINWEFSPGGTLRELILRYPHVKPVTMFRFGLHILTALSYLHERGIAHGKVCMDKVQVSADGKCRLTGHSGDRRLTRELFYQHQNCYMSPLMATGALPTPQCDMFCFGLGSVEALTKQPPWKWATRDDGQLLGTAAELAELMKVGGQPFSDALLQGRVEVNLDPLSEASVINSYSRRVVEPIIACLSLDPTKRPTAMQVRAINKEMLLQAGLTLEEDELAQVSSDEDT